MAFGSNPKAQFHIALGRKMITPMNYGGDCSHLVLPVHGQEMIVDTIAAFWLRSGEKATCDPVPIKYVLPNGAKHMDIVYGSEATDAELEEYKNLVKAARQKKVA
jgi:hypothetical protein